MQMKLQKKVNNLSSGLDKVDNSQKKLAKHKKTGDPRKAAAEQRSSGCIRRVRRFDW
jgi:hypothetical protein